MKSAIKVIVLWVTSNIALLLAFALFINLLNVGTVATWESIPVVVYISTLIMSTIFVLIIGVQISDNMWKDKGTDYEPKFKK